MINNHLLYKIKLLQNNYLTLLKKVLPSLTESNYLLALDEIYLFWVEQEKLVDLFLNYEFSGSDSFFFTGATDIEYDSGEHFPLMLLGKYHVFDDPLCRFSDFCITYDNFDIQKKLYEKSIKCVKNNIKILENCDDKILILPVRINNRTKASNYFFEASETFFNSYFKEIKTVDEYLKRCQTIDDVILELHDGVESCIGFFDFEDYTLPLKKRFLSARKRLRYYYSGQKTNDVMLFLNSQMSMFFQTFDLLTTCLLYNAFPLVRSQKVLLNFLQLCENINDEQLRFNMKLNSCIAYFVYMELSSMETSKIEITHFYMQSVETDFYNTISKKLEKQNFSSENISLLIVKGTIEEELAKLFSRLIIAE